MCDRKPAGEKTKKDKGLFGHSTLLYFPRGQSHCFSKLHLIMTVDFPSVFFIYFFFLFYISTLFSYLFLKSIS